MKKKYRIGIIGLGYVGLPLAIEFGKIFDVRGYDKKNIRIIFTYHRNVIFFGYV